MDVAHEQRLARNEALFREVNEHIREVAAGHGGDEHVYEFVCECADAQCRELVPLTLAAYEEIRASGSRFLVVPGHAVPAVEDVVATAADHVVVEKVGAAGAVAERLDPRAG